MKSTISHALVMLLGALAGAAGMHFTAAPSPPAPQKIDIGGAIAVRIDGMPTPPPPAPAPAPEPTPAKKAKITGRFIAVAIYNTDDMPKLTQSQREIWASETLAQSLAELGGSWRHLDANDSVKSHPEWEQAARKLGLPAVAVLDASTKNLAVIDMMPVKAADDEASVLAFVAKLKGKP